MRSAAQKVHIALHGESAEIERGVHGLRPVRAPALAVTVTHGDLEKFQALADARGLVRQRDVRQRKLEKRKQIIRGHCAVIDGFHLGSEKLFQRRVEHDDVSVRAVVLPNSEKLLTNFDYFPRHPPRVAVLQHVVHLPRQVARQTVPGKVHGAVHVPARVRGL